MATLGGGGGAGMFLRRAHDDHGDVALPGGGAAAAAAAAAAATGAASASAVAPGATTRTTRPYVTGTSVLGVKFADGVLLAADTLGSYGSLARFKALTRLRKANETTLIGGSGDYSDFQAICRMLDEKDIDDFTKDDGVAHSPPQLHSWLSRILYNQRNRFNPLWNTLLVAGFDKTTNEPFLGYADLQGTNCVDDYFATGYGAYIALPLMRDAHRADMSEADARALLERCMRVLFYRECRTINRVQFAAVTKSGGVRVDEPVELATEWDFAEHVSHGAEGSW